jgi:lantibiotic transport system permease protein
MSDLARSIRVELLKLRRTLALWVSLLVPLVVIVMTAAMNFARARETQFVLDRPNGWDSLMLDQTLVLWCFVLLPLFVTLETALLAGVEHRENAWKHLFALPVPRWTVYVSKLLVSFALVCLSSVVLALGTGLQGLTIAVLRPDLGLTRPVPWELILLRNFGFVPVVLLMIAIQMWVAVRWRSFSVPMGLGVIGTLVSIMLLRTLKNSLSTPHGPFFASIFPWSLPYVVIAPQAYTNVPETTPVLRATALFVGVMGGLVASILGCWETSRRDVE